MKQCMNALAPCNLTCKLKEQADKVDENQLKMSRCMRKKKRFLTRTDTNQPVQSQKKVKSFKFQIHEEEGFTICVAKTKALISCAVTVQLICAFVFTYANCYFSFVAAQSCNSEVGLWPTDMVI